MNLRIRNLIEAFAEDLGDAIREEAQEAIEVALTQGSRGSLVFGAHLRRRPAARQASVSLRLAERPKGAKRPPDEIEKLIGKLRDYVKAHPGERIEQIAKAIGVETSDLKLPAQKLREEKSVVMKGTRRAAKYYPK